MLAQHAQGPGFNLSSPRKQNQTKYCNNYCWLGCLERGRASFLVWRSSVTGYDWFLWVFACCHPKSNSLVCLSPSCCVSASVCHWVRIQSAGGWTWCVCLRETEAGSLSSLPLTCKFAKFPQEIYYISLFVFTVSFFSNAQISYRKCVRDLSIVFCTRLCPWFRTPVIPATGDWLFVSRLPDKWSTF